jgi:hypothetical protein
VSEPQTLAKAEFVELDSTFKDKAGGKRAKVQFNPESLKVSYANQLAQQGGGGAKGGTGANEAAAAPQTGGASRQFVGSGTTKLSVQLWFDVTGPDGGGKADVTRLTDEVTYFMTPQELGENKEKLPPNVSFHWGAFHFDGTFDSLETTFEFFSHDGRPLRAQVSLTMSRQRIEPSFTEGDAPALGGGAGRRPLTPAPTGATLQGLAAGVRGGAGWQGIAAANAIEDPLRLAPGQLVDLNLSVSTPF